MTTTKPRGALIEIIEPVGSPEVWQRTEEVGVIVPREIRINGMPLLCPRDEPVEVHAITINGDEPVRVTLTVWARRVLAEARDASREVSVDTLLAELEELGHLAPGRLTAALEAVLPHVGQPGLQAVAEALGVTR